jgi:hypothetical protein
MMVFAVIGIGFGPVLVPMEGGIDTGQSIQTLDRLGFIDTFGWMFQQDGAQADA